MSFVFSDAAPWGAKPILISGTDSEQLPHKKYVISETDDLNIVYEIGYESHCSPFKQAMYVDNILAVGFEEDFYLFNTATNTNILDLKMESYFGHFYFNNDLYYVADAHRISCVNKKGSIIWQTGYLGIDGVIIEDLKDNKIFGSGEWDPPGGWRDFILDMETGNQIK